MPFSLSDDEALIAKTVAEFAQAAIGLEQAADQDRHDAYPTAAVEGLAGLGLLGVGAPEAAGGAGPTAFALTVLELAKVCPNTAAVLTAHTACVRAAAWAGADDLLKRLASGEVGAWLATEEAHGADKRQYGTMATRDGDDWTLTGQKVWGVSGSDAAHFLVTAQAPGGPTLFLAAPDAQGVERGRNEPLLGLRACGIRTVYLSDVVVQDAQRLGGEGAALEVEQAVRPWLQLGAAAALLGAAAGAKAAADDFAASRVQFQKPVGMFQAVSDAVAAMDVQVAAGRALLLEAAAHLEGDKGLWWTARAKEMAQEVAVAVTRRAIRVQGGTGFMREGGTERFARDVRALQFMGEPFAIQRDTIRREVLALDFGPGA